MTKANPTAAMLVIGDEVLSGRTRDANTSHLATELTAMGVALREARVVADEPDAIADAVNALRVRYDYVFTSGGIGPTHDDITAESVAAAFGVPIGVRDDARAILEAYYPPGDLNEARLRMARIPDGASLILNPISQAPGFRLENVFVMAGVPEIFKTMLQSAMPEITGGAATLSWALRAPLPEGDIAVPLGEVAVRHPDVSTGCYPFYRPGMGVTLVARSSDRTALEAAVADLRAMMVGLGAAEISETPPD